MATEKMIKAMFDLVGALMVVYLLCKEKNRTEISNIPYFLQTVNTYRIHLLGVRIKKTPEHTGYREESNVKKILYTSCVLKWM